MITTIILFAAAAICLIVSFLKNKDKTKESFKLSKNMFLGLFKEILGILLLLGLILTLIPPETISAVLGNENEIMSTVSGAAIGTVTIIPGVIAFPLAKELLEKGAVLMALAAFITTLTMVGFATVPIEVNHLGKKFTLYRNLLSFGFAILIALLMGVLL